jgi:DHA1 family tetracycline resistance protein-like MFS transporter
MPILFVTILIDLIGFGIVIPILPFMAPQLGADKMDIAFLIVIYAVCAGFCGPFWGRLSDRLGRKPVMLMCLAGAAISYLLLGFSTELWMIFGARAFAGMMAGNYGVVSAMIADSTTPANRARGMGMLGAAFGLGLVVGPVLGGLLAGPDNSFALPCMVAGGMSILAMIAAQLFLSETLTEERRSFNREHQRTAPPQTVFAMLRETHNTLMVAQFAVHTTCMSSVTYLFPLWVGDNLGWGARETGMVFGVQGLIMAVLQGVLVGPLASRFGELPFLRTGLCVMIGGFVLAVFADGARMMVISSIVAVTGATFCMPILNTIATLRTPQQYRGRMMGTTSSAASWGRVSGPLVAGVNLHFFGYSVAWAFCAVAGCLYLGWALAQHSTELAKKGRG